MVLARIKILGMRGDLVDKEEGVRRGKVSEVELCSPGRRSTRCCVEGGGRCLRKMSQSRDHAIFEPFAGGKDPKRKIWERLAREKKQGTGSLPWSR
jgi:hypothetical protein